MIRDISLFIYVYWVNEAEFHKMEVNLVLEFEKHFRESKIKIF